MSIYLCAIGRRENLYAREFVEHYKKLGFDGIYILDNNHDGEGHFQPRRASNGLKVDNYKP